MISILISILVVSSNDVVASDGNRSVWWARCRSWDIRLKHQLICKYGTRVHDYSQGLHQAIRLDSQRCNTWSLADLILMLQIPLTSVFPEIASVLPWTICMHCSWWLASTWTLSQIARTVFCLSLNSPFIWVIFAYQRCLDRFIFIHLVAERWKFRERIKDLLRVLVFILIWRLNSRSFSLVIYLRRLWLFTLRLFS